MTHDINNPLRPLGDNTLTLNGTTDFRAIPNDAALNFARDQNFTVCAWIRAERSQKSLRTTDNYIIEKWSSGGRYPYVIRLLNERAGQWAGRLHCGRYDGSKTSAVRSPMRIDDGAFHHVAFVRATGKLKLYVDGKLVSESSDGVSGETRNGSALFLGKRGTSGTLAGFFAGAIRDLSIYEVALDDEQVVAASGINRPPVANVGSGREIVVGEQVRMNPGVGSDPDGNPLTYAWELQAPADSKASLDDASSPTPGFVADMPGEFTLRLVVSDGQASSLPATVTWIAKAPPNRAPVAHLEAGETELETGDTVMLDGSKSTDADSDQLTLTWSIMSKPEGSTASLGNVSAPQVSFTPDVPGEYVLSLSAFDGKDHSEPVAAKYIVKPSNQRPTVSTGPNGSTTVGSPIALSAEASDPEGKPLTYSWTLSKPAESEAALDDPSSASPSFTPDIPGPYTAHLSVSDGQASTEARAVVWNALPVPAPTRELTYHFSEAVLAKVLAEHKLGEADKDALLALAKTLDDGNRYLKTEELEAAASKLVEQAKADVDGYRFSDNVVATVMAKYKLTDKAALLHTAVSYDADHNRYLKRSELESAAAALEQRQSSLSGREWSAKVLAEVLAKYGLNDENALLLEAVNQRQHDRYFSRTELEQAAKALTAANAPAASEDAPAAGPRHDGPWGKVEAFLGPFAFMIRAGSTAEAMDEWQAAQGVELSAEVRELMQEAGGVELPTPTESPSYAAEVTLLPLREWVRLDRSSLAKEAPDMASSLDIPNAKLGDLVLIGEDPLGVDNGCYVMLHAPTSTVHRYKGTDGLFRPLGSMSEWISNTRIKGVDQGASYPGVYRNTWNNLTGEPGTVDSLGEEHLRRVGDTITGRSGARGKRWTQGLEQFRACFDAL